MNGHTVTELAARWQVDEETAQGFLEQFKRRGLAEEHDGRWQATDLACRRFGFLVGLGDNDKAAA